MKRTIRCLSLLLTMSVMLLIHPAKAQSPEKLFGGFLGLLEKQIRKEEERQKRRESQQNTTYNSSDSTPVTLPKIDGISLGDSLSEDQLTRQLSVRCEASASYRSMKFCSETVDKKTTRGNFQIKIEALIDEDDAVRYLSKTYLPAFWSNGEMDDDILRHEKSVKSSPEILPLRDRTKDIDSKMAIWGNLTLVTVDKSSYRKPSHSNSANDRILVDHLSEMSRSIREGVPIYRPAKGQGYVWVGNSNSGGLGTLRFFLIDASFLTGRLMDAGTTSAVTNVVPRNQEEIDKILAEQSKLKKLNAERQKRQLAELTDKREPRTILGFGFLDGVRSTV